MRWSQAKVPLTVAGRPASSTDSATWSTYGRARGSTAGVGLGYVLAAGDGVVCLDLDHVLVDGTPTMTAQRLLDRLPATYVEMSPSGGGLHVWGRADVPQGRRLRVDGVAVEVYGTGRYMTVTGRRWHGAPSRLADLSGVVAELT